MISLASGPQICPEGLVVVVGGWSHIPVMLSDRLFFPASEMARFSYFCYYIFIGRTDVEAETPIRWPPDAKN